MLLATNTHFKQQGAVSIFIVIFTALLVTIVTTSFVQIMLRNQQQASDNDLSQSAYDSAMAGVEDAKRALVKLKTCKRDATQPGCDVIQSLVTDGNNCEVLESAGIANFQNGEVQVGNDPALNQAYTCVNVEVETESYEDDFADQETVVIPLVPVGDPNDIQAVRISWYTDQDIPDSDPDNLPTVPARTGLVQYDRWGDDVPPMMRAQLIQFDGAQPINLASFDGGNARTRLLYPLFGARPQADDFASDSRRTAGINSPSYGGCQQNFDYFGYACSFTVAIPAQAGTREAYLQLASVYNQRGVHYRVELVGAGGIIVPFDNVQPRVDSTGRASDLFRRVSARVSVSEAGSSLPFPEASVSTNNLCKEFFITNDGAAYNGDGNGDNVVCTP